MNNPSFFYYGMVLFLTLLGLLLTVLSFRQDIAKQKPDRSDAIIRTTKCGT
jgi:hypothetical protein